MNDGGYSVSNYMPPVPRPNSLPGSPFETLINSFRNYSSIIKVCMSEDCHITQGLSLLINDSNKAKRKL